MRRERSWWWSPVTRRAGRRPTNGPRRRLATDTRGRIPFALLGALLLAVSVGAVATVEQTPTGETDTAGSEATAELVAVESSALRSGTRAGAATAAADPVTAPANTSYGAVLDDGEPFRSQVELLVYDAVASRLDHANATDGSVTATTTLPPITNATTAASALDRTTIEAAGPGAVRVAIDGAERIVSSGNRTVERTPTTLEARVATPALTLHERTAAYEQALDSGPTSGVGPAFSGRVNGIAWARGLLQYAGGPIEQVLAPRHVELAFNDAALAEQRRQFGTGDERLSRGLVRQGAQLTGEAIGAGNESIDPRAPNAPAGPPLQDDFRPDWFERSRDAAPTPVPIGPQAEIALDRLFRGADGDSLTDVIDDVYSADVQAATSTEITAVDGLETPETPRSNWSLVDVDKSTTVTNISTGTGTGGATLPADWRPIETFTRSVRVEATTVRTYDRPDDSPIETRERTARTHAVDIDLGIRLGHSDHAPERSRAGFEPKGVFEAIDETATAEYVETVGDPDALAATVASGESLPTHTVDVPAPPALEDEVRSELWALSDDLADESVTVDRGRVATGENPAKQLHAELESKADEYVGAPASYDGPAQKAHVAARAAYLDRLLEHLEGGADVVEEMQSAVDVAARVDESVGDEPVDDVLVASADAVRPSPSSIETADPTASLSLDVQSDPAYFTSSRVDRKHIRTANRSHTPAAIRTINAVSLPTRSIAEYVAEVTGGLLFDEAADLPLQTAAQTLAAVDAVPVDERSSALDDQRATLHNEVETSFEAVQADAADGLEPVTPLDEDQRTAVVADGFDTWATLDEQVAAAGNGTAATAITTAVVEHDETTPAAIDRERVELRMTAALAEAMDDASASVPEGPIRDALDEARGQTEAVVADITEDGLERGQNRLNSRLRSGSGRVPLGVPIAPPVAWVGTVNGWTAQVRGEYASFAVESDRGGPGGAPVTYQRSGQAVEYDLTGDGTPERLGTAERLSFSTWTTAIVAVPPGRSGVGNTDGHTVLKTPAWPEPGFEAAEATDTDDGG